MTWMVRERSYGLLCMYIQQTEGMEWWGGLSRQKYGLGDRM